MTRSVQSLMTKDLVVVGWTETLTEAYKKMKTRSVRHLPVVDDDGSIVGLISDRDFMRALQVEQPDFASGYMPKAEFDSSSTVRDYMSWPVEAIDASISVAEVARIMLDKKISALLVTMDESVAGIVTTDDILREFLADHESIADRVRQNVDGLLVNTPVGRIVQTISDAGI